MGRCDSLGTRDNLDVHLFTSFFSISVLQIRELWIGQRIWSHLFVGHASWKRTAVGPCGASEVLTDVEGLTVV